MQSRQLYKRKMCYLIAVKNGVVVMAQVIISIIGCRYHTLSTRTDEWHLAFTVSVLDLSDVEHQKRAVSVVLRIALVPGNKMRQC